jgi:hypothetical protein
MVQAATRLSITRDLLTVRDLVHWFLEVDVLRPILLESESPYQRLPVNNRRRANKRVRDGDDLFDVNTGQKIPRYYE